MDFSIRKIQNYYKLVNSRRSLPNSPSIDKNSDSILQRTVPLINSPLAEIKGLKSYQDHHLFKNIMVSSDDSADVPKKPFISRQKTEQVGYQPLSKRRDMKKLKTLCYNNQKTQRNLKNQQAMIDLSLIQEISFNSFDKDFEKSVRFNKDFDESSTQVSFQKWRTVPKERHRNSNSPFKNRLTVGKRAKNSPKKTSMSLRARKTFIHSGKDSQRLINLSTVESQNKLTKPPSLIQGNLSITPWEIEEEDLY